MRLQGEPASLNPASKRFHDHRKSLISFCVAIEGRALVHPVGNPNPVCCWRFLGFPAERCTSNLLILVQLIGGKFARERAANGCELASGCTRFPCETGRTFARIAAVCQPAVGG